MITIESVSKVKTHGGWHQQFNHQSKVLNCSMRFAIYLPETASESAPVPVLYWLSGLTCTDENFMQKAAAFSWANKAGVAIVAPDTSPRGEGIADDPEGAYDLGVGAGFYVNATQAPWREHYQMYSYIVDELPQIIENNFPVSNLRSIAGHSMGGHGALVIGLRNPKRYCSISAFAPITNPINCPWGKKAFGNYLGDDVTTWQTYDACELLSKHKSSVAILVDQGDADNFLQEQLKPENLVEAAKQSNSKLNMRIQPGYDHSYYFIQSFIGEHIKFHADQLLKHSHN